MYRKIRTLASAAAVILNATAFAAGPAGANPSAEGVPAARYWPRRAMPSSRLARRTEAVGDGD
jgi:hypothetical protein